MWKGHRADTRFAPLTHTCPAKELQAVSPVHAAATSVLETPPAADVDAAASGAQRQTHCAMVSGRDPRGALSLSKTPAEGVPQRKQEAPMLGPKQDKCPSGRVCQPEGLSGGD